MEALTATRKVLHLTKGETKKDVPSYCTFCDNTDMHTMKFLSYDKVRETVRFEKECETCRQRLVRNPVRVSVTVIEKLPVNEFMAMWQQNWD